MTSRASPTLGPAATGASVAPHRHDHLDSVAVGVLLLCCALWGLQQIAIKVAVPDVPPLLQSALRSIGATLLVWLWAAWKRIPLFRRDGTLGAGIAAGVLFAGEFVCIYLSLRYTLASRTVVFIYLAPFVVALGLPWFVPAERLRPSQLAGLACAFLAVAFAFQEGLGLPGRGQLLGDALAVAGALLWGMTTLVIRATRLSGATAEKTLFYQLGVSALILPLASWAAGESWPQHLSALAAGSLFFQTVIVAFASYLAWFWLLRHYPATKLSAFSFLTPMFGLAFGALLLGEPVSARLVGALAAVAVGIYLVNRRA